MKVLVPLLLAAAVFAAGSALAQQPPQGRGAQMQKQGMQPREGMRNDRREFRRERMDRRDGERGRFSREERDKLRQDLLDANRDMKGRR
jgi:Ni/Co efflux regulator RcnB